MKEHAREKPFANTSPFNQWVDLNKNKRELKTYDFVHTGSKINFDSVFFSFNPTTQPLLYFQDAYALLSSPEITPKIYQYKTWHVQP